MEPDLSTRISDALAADPATEDAVIEVINENGVVTLVGEVDSRETVEIASAIAASQPGTISVVNSLKIAH
jgi:osmotically-inducible protein OsmY